MRGNDKAVDVDDDDDHYGECADISDDEDVEHIQVMDSLYWRNTWLCLLISLMRGPWLGK